MMNRIKYWNKNVAAIVRRGLFCFCLCTVLLTACGGNDKAVVLNWQKEGTEESGSELEPEVPDTNPVSQGTDDENVGMIYVHVCGAVVSPGVVELQDGSRAEDALLAAGGFREDAAEDYVNLAFRVEDGQQLYFPTEEETQMLTENPVMLQEQTAQSGKVNINTADEELLCTLPGIGKSRAQDIIAYREEHGSFQSIEDIMQVSGIKQSSYEKLCDKITVN